MIFAARRLPAAWAGRQGTRRAHEPLRLGVAEPRWPRHCTRATVTRRPGHAEPVSPRTSVILVALPGPLGPVRRSTMDAVRRPA